MLNILKITHGSLANFSVLILHDGIPTNDIDNAAAISINDNGTNADGKILCTCLLFVS